MVGNRIVTPPFEGGTTRLTFDGSLELRSQDRILLDKVAAKSNLTKLSSGQGRGYEMA